VGTRTVARSDTGRVREGNEDRYVVREHRGVLLMAIADGVGGEEGGEIAADAAVVELAERFFSSPRERALEERVGDAMRDANTAVLRAAESSGNPQAAATLVAAVVAHDHLVVANLGDSRAYLVRDGAPRQLTEDHSGEAANAITRFVGDPRGVQPDVFVEDLGPTDRLVLCSDGLTRHVKPEEIAATLAAHPVDRAADALVELANVRGGEDNVTVVIHDARRARSALGPRRLLALGIILAIVLIVVVGTFAVLVSIGPR
jgi:serine/threonine protein phosphatase PrpC